MDAEAAGNLCAGLTEGDAGDGVSTLQNYLRQFGWLPPENAPRMRSVTPEQGSFDVATAAALRDYQDWYGLPATGVLDEATVTRMSQPRCGVPDLVTVAPLAPFAGRATERVQRAFRYAFHNFLGGIPQADVQATFQTAADTWQDAAFVHVLPISDVDRADMRVLFAGNDHGDSPFDVPGLDRWAHAFPPGSDPLSSDMHFDNTETWSTATPTPAAAVDLESVALHEMGHAIGLDHSPDTDAVMYAYLNPGQTKRRLTGGDVVAIRDLYGAAAVVPHASEMTAGNAAKAVKEAGLDFRYSPKWIANAYVIGQTPPEGTRVAAGSIVTLRVRALSGGGGPGNPGGNPP